MSFLDLATGEIEVLADEDRGVLSTPDGSRLLIEGVDSDEESGSAASWTDRREMRWRCCPVPLAGISADGTVVLTDYIEGGGIATWDVSAGQPEEPSGDDNGLLSQFAAVAGWKHRGTHERIRPST